MKKVTVSLPQGEWGSLKTKYPKDSDQVKFTDFTGSSNNFDTEVTGAITKRPGTNDFLATSNPPSDQFEAVFPSGARHMLVMDGGTLKYSAGAPSLSTVTAGFSASGNFEFAEYLGRVYGGNGIDNPIVYDTTATYGGVTYTVPRTRTMGCPVPTAPTVALQTDSTANQVPAGGHTYKVTYLYYSAEESNGSPASSVVTADGTHTRVTITIPAGGDGVTARKIYRDNNDGNYLYLGSVSNNTAPTFSDVYAIGTTPIPTDSGLPPVFGKVTLHLDRLWVSNSGNTITYSEPGTPDIFSATGYVVCNSLDTIIGHVVYQGKLMILNRNSIGWIVGSSKSDFAYVSTAGNVGCVDNRSIQIRTTDGVPTVVFLSDKGFYEYNGSALVYVSQDVEDQLSLNIQQGSASRGKHLFDSQADFSSPCVASDGITISDGGIVSQINPKKAFQSESDWADADASPTNVAVRSTRNTIQCPVGTTFALASGTFSNCSQSGSNVSMNTFVYTNPYYTAGHYQTVLSRHVGNGIVIAPDLASQAAYYAQKFVLDRAATITSLGAYFKPYTGSRSCTVVIYTDSNGQPGSPQHTFGTLTVGAGASGFQAISGSQLLPAGSYWVCFQLISGGGYWYGDFEGWPNGTTGHTGTLCSQNGGASWLPVLDTNGATCQEMGTYISLTDMPVAQSGDWTSDVYDCQADGGLAGSVTCSGSYPTHTSATVTLYGGTGPSTFDLSQVISSPNGATSISLAGRRFWKVVTHLVTTDDTYSPTVGTPSMVFNTTATWISPAIDMTADVTALNSLDVTSAAPGSTTATVTIATSSNNSSYSGYTSLGAATPARYAKIKAVVTASADDSATAAISNITLKWTLVSTLSSSVVDASVVPFSWDVFQASFAGGVTFQFRTAATSGGLSGASYSAITNGAVPSNAVYRYSQWKATLTATADAAPTLDSVTINWFLSTAMPLRACSMFYGRCYYLAAAEFGHTSNDVVFKLDYNGKWRVYRGLDLATMCLFFNTPYAGLANANKVVQWLTGTTDSGVVIALDVQTGAINYEDKEHNKILRKVYVIGKNTGAAYTPQYSSDAGLTWNGMIDVETGLSTFTTTTDGGLFKRRFQPDFSAGNATGPTHILRLANNDACQCEIHGVKVEAWIRQGEPR